MFRSDDGAECQSQSIATKWKTVLRRRPAKSRLLFEVVATGRLLNFFWQASRAWKLEFDGNPKMVNSKLVLAVLSKESEGA